MELECDTYEGQTGSNDTASGATSHLSDMADSSADFAADASSVTSKFSEFSLEDVHPEPGIGTDQKCNESTRESRVENGVAYNGLRPSKSHGRWLFLDVTFLDCEFSDAHFRRCTFLNCTFKKCSFDGAIFEDLFFDNVTIEDWEFRGTTWKEDECNFAVLPPEDFQGYFGGMAKIKTGAGVPMETENLECLRSLEARSTRASRERSQHFVQRGTSVKGIAPGAKPANEVPHVASSQGESKGTPKSASAGLVGFGEDGSALRGSNTTFDAKTQSGATRLSKAFEIWTVTAPSPPTMAETDKTLRQGHDDGLRAAILRNAGVNGSSSRPIITDPHKLTLKPVAPIAAPPSAVRDPICIAPDGRTSIDNRPQEATKDAGVKGAVLQARKSTAPKPLPAKTFVSPSQQKPIHYQPRSVPLAKAQGTLLSLASTKHSQEGITGLSVNCNLVEANTVLTAEPMLLLSADLGRPQDQRGEAAMFMLEKAKQILTFDEVLANGAVIEGANASWDYE